MRKLQKKNLKLAEVALVVKNLLPVKGWKRGSLDPWVRKVPWRRKWQPTPEFLPGESHREESGGLQSMGSCRVKHS